MTRSAQLPKAPRPIRLDNGVRVVCVPTVKAGSRVERSSATGHGACAIQLWIAGGTASEGAKEHGAAHFTEHMVFRPWGEGAGEDLASGIEFRGGEVNAYTAHDETVYYTSVAASEALGALAIMRRAVFEPNFEPDAFRREREVIVEEIGQYADDGSSVVADRSAEAVYPDHAYGRPILGTVAELKALTARRLAAFHRRVYVGSRVTLVVVGPIPRRQVLAWARKNLGSLPKGRPAKAPKRWPQTPKAAVEVASIPGADAQLRVAWSGPGVSHEDAVALDLLSVVLGQGDGARMGAALRREQGIAVEAHAAFVAGAQAGTFVMVATATPEKATQCARALIDLRAALRARPVRQQEVDAARDMLETSIVYRRETVSGQAHAFGYYATVSEEPGLEARYFEVLRRLGPADLARVAAQHLSLGRAQLCLGLPSNGAKGAAPSPARRRSVAKQLRAYLDASSAPRPDVAPARARWQRTDTLWQCEVAEGLRLIVHPDPSLPIVAGCLAWPGGQRVEVESEAGLGQLLARTVTQGDDERTALGTARWLDRRAAGLDGFFGRNASGLSFESTTPDFADLLDLTFHAGAHPRLDGLDVTRERDVALEELAAEVHDGGTASIRQALSAMYGGAHPYARSMRGRAAVLRRASPERLRERWRRHDLRDAVLAVAGDVDPERLAKRVDELAQRWPKGERLKRVGATKVSAPAKTLSRSGRRAEIAQSHVALGYLAVPEGHRDGPALEIAAEILGAQSGPLFEALREREGLVYGVGVGVTAGHDAGHLLAHVSASGENFKRAKAGLLNTISDFAAAGPSPQQFARGRATLLGHLERAWQRRAAVAAALTMHAIRGKNPETVWQWSARIAEVGPEDVRRVAATYLAKPAVISVIKPS